MKKEIEKIIIEEIKNFNWDANFDDEGKPLPNCSDGCDKQYAVYKIRKWEKMLVEGSLPEGVEEDIINQRIKEDPDLQTNK